MRAGVECLRAGRRPARKHDDLEHDLKQHLEHRRPDDDHAAELNHHDDLKGRCIVELIQLVVILIVIGVLLWLVNTYIPMDARIKQIINAVVIIAVILWLLAWLLAIVGVSPHMRIGPGA